MRAIFRNKDDDVFEQFLEEMTCLRLKGLEEGRCGHKRKGGWVILF